jgi:hypothetical protein
VLCKTGGAGGVCRWWQLLLRWRCTAARCSSEGGDVYRRARRLSLKRLCNWPGVVARERGCVGDHKSAEQFWVQVQVVVVAKLGLTSTHCEGSVMARAFCCCALAFSSIAVSRLPTDGSEIHRLTAAGRELLFCSGPSPSHPPFRSCFSSPRRQDSSLKLPRSKSPGTATRH